ncbi:MAG: hypothetical protein AAGN66_06375 [Acidobacteriota bacterium]
MTPSHSHHPAHGAQPPRRTRPFVRLVAFALLALFMPIFVFGATVAATGTVMVQVHERGPDGVHLLVPVPALLFDVAAFAVPRMLPQDALAEVRRELEPIRPALDAMAQELLECPPGVLVEVRDGAERVHVIKERRTYRIEVHSDDADIEVSVPARLLGKSLDIFG